MFPSPPCLWFFCSRRNDPHQQRELSWLLKAFPPQFFPCGCLSESSQSLYERLFFQNNKTLQYAVLCKRTYSYRMSLQKTGDFSFLPQKIPCGGFLTLQYGQRGPHWVKPWNWVPSTYMLHLPVLPGEPSSLYSGLSRQNHSKSSFN